MEATPKTPKTPVSDEAIEWRERRAENGTGARPGILMHPHEVLTLAQAVHRAGRSSDTVRRWCRKYGIARQIGANGRLEISALALEMVLHSDFFALSLLREGRREVPEVQRYASHLDLSA